MFLQSFQEKIIKGDFIFQNSSIPKDTIWQPFFINKSFYYFFSITICLKEQILSKKKLHKIMFIRWEFCLFLD